MDAATPLTEAAEREPPVLRAQADAQDVVASCFIFIQRMNASYRILAPLYSLL